jgi:hypothetical protein
MVTTNDDIRQQSPLTTASIRTCERCSTLLFYSEPPPVLLRDTEVQRGADSKLNQDNVCSLSHHRLTRPIDDIRQQENPDAEVTIAEIIAV